MTDQYDVASAEARAGRRGLLDSGPYARQERGDRGNWPSPLDSLPMGVDDPPNYHHRKLTGDGYPVMGSSPAEREESRQRGERIRKAAMRNHPFEGEGPYCEARISFAPITGDSGTITGWKGCGYSRDMHPAEVPPEAPETVPPGSVLPGNPDDGAP